MEAGRGITKKVVAASKAMLPTHGGRNSSTLLLYLSVRLFEVDSYAAA